MSSSTDPIQKSRLSLVESIKLLKDIRLWRILVLGFASGYPWIIIGGSTLSIWLREEGFSRTSIGIFGLVFTAYTINFLWAPMLDAVKFKWLSGIGQRRSWILVCQIALVLLTLLMAVCGPSLNIMAFALMAVGVGFFSATQDLAIDAYRITIIRPDEKELIPFGAAMATSGWWLGFGLPAAFLLYLSDMMAWSYVYGIAALMIVPVAMLVLYWFEEPDVPPGSVSKEWYTTVVVEYVETIKDFFGRHGAQIALSLLLFIFLFKIGEAFLGRMVGVFYVEVGYTKTEIATFSKLISTTITIVFAFCAGALMPRLGVFKMLFFAGIAMAITNLMFAWIAMTGPDLTLFLAAVVTDGITSSISTVAFVAFITYYVSHLHAAGQYGALASLGNAGRTLLAGFSGLVVDSLGGNWALFFVLTSVAVVPALIVLLSIALSFRRQGSSDSHAESPTASQ